MEQVIKDIHDAYNYDGSEVQFDYFDVNYYGQAEVELYTPPPVVEGVQPLRKTGTLADLKRTIAPGVVLEVVSHPHWEAIVGVKRPVSQTRTGSFALATKKNGGTVDSWIDFGRASDVTFDKEAGEFLIGQIRYRIVPEAQQGEQV